MAAKKRPTIPLPRSWTKHVRSAMLQVVSLAQYATVYTRSWAVDSRNGRVRLKAENDRLQQEEALQREEIRSKARPDCQRSTISCGCSCQHARFYDRPLATNSVVQESPDQHSCW